VAVRCGSVDAVAALLSHCANILLTDEHGWTAAHHAAYFDQQRILRMFTRRNAALIELATADQSVVVVAFITPDVLSKRAVSIKRSATQRTLRNEHNNCS